MENTNIDTLNQILNTQPVSNIPENQTIQQNQNVEGNNSTSSMPAEIEKKQIIVNGQDITNLPVQQLTEELAEAMTDAQKDEYTKTFTTEERQMFNSLLGIAVAARTDKLSEEELKKRSESRLLLSSSLSSKTNTPDESTAATEEQTIEKKTEQTGSVIFGVKN